MMKYSLAFLIFSLWYLPTNAQIEFEYIFPSVSGEVQILDMAFAGGINSAQFHTLDMDGDEDLDLVLFDRSSDKINTFENTGTGYTYRPSFEYLFPEELSNWIVLADYDCDGFKDLFTYTGQGIRVFKNLSSGGQFGWELVAEPLKTEGSSSQINLLFNATDIPSISDIDGDGDLDILVFDFASSFQIEHHKNYSIEVTGSCGLAFVRESRSYGEISDCGCDDFVVDTPCASDGRIYHAGGKAILSIDYNNDDRTDIVLSQEACENLSFAENIGTSSAPAFDSFENTFPTFNSQVGFISFPSAFFEDVTFDGRPDLLISSNERSNGVQDIDFKNSSFVYSNSGNNSSNNFGGSIPFLQDKMIDVGEFAYPAIGDIDGDGANDLVVGNSGSLLDGTFTSSLTYFQVNSSGMFWQTDNLFDLSSLGFTYIKPQFVDLNNDRAIDLVFSARNSLNDTRLYYLLNQEQNGVTFDLDQLVELDVLLSFLDDFHLLNIDDDDLPDLLIGLSSGRLDYYRNRGTAESPSFLIETEEYLGLTSNFEFSNLSITSGDLNDDGNIDLITTDRTGLTKIYEDIGSGNSAAQLSTLTLDDQSSPVITRFGRVTKPAFGELLERNVLAIGSIQGGVRLLASSGTSGEIALSLNAYPVPSLDDGMVSFVTNLSGTKLEIFSLTGKKILETSLTAFTKYTIHLSQLKAGLYLAKATNGNQSCTSKIVLHY